MQTVESIPITLGREEDRRWWADIESIPLSDGVRRDARGSHRSRACAGVAGGGGLH